ncbi:MAG: dienelactone hydrolase family protein [Solirubrobacteraceae bacterium]|nr:dienelactone hydrolase family protein [Solirubrobacteraceae bacterium]
MSPKTSLVSALALLATAAVPATALAGPYDKGPAPTAANLVSATGPYSVKQTAVSNNDTPGFGAATVWSPSNAAPGETFGAIAIAPGFTEGESAIKWLGPQLASKGFVVATINVNNTFIDLPNTRGKQLNFALAYLTDLSPVKNLVDPERLGVIGHSMGGGATFEAARTNPKIDAAVGLAPWSPSGDFSDLNTANLIVGAENDIIAPMALHSNPFYASLADPNPRAKIVIKGADHFVTNSKSDTVAAITTSWVKRYVDQDTRYTAALGANPLGTVAAKVQSYKTANVN